MSKNSLDLLCAEKIESVDPRTIFDKIHVGRVEDFTVAELWGCNHDIIIRKNEIFVVYSESSIHGFSVSMMREYLDRSFSSTKNEVCSEFRFVADRGIPMGNIPDIYGCTKHRMRSPDAVVNLCDSLSRAELEAILVVEVRFRNKSFSDLLTLGAGYLSSRTPILYALLIDLEEEAINGERRLVSVRALLLKRKARKFIQNGESLPPLECVELPEWLDVPELITKDVIERDLGVKVLLDQRITREDVASDEFKSIIKLKCRTIVRHCQIPGLLRNRIVKVNLKSVARKIFTYVDALDAAGTYPYAQATRF